jgi:predicted glycoside hydrolase/deacetylase ChbG (UPF0249 family)
MERKVIINGDDFGMRAEVNEAIAKAATEGILTSASIIVNMEASEEAVKIAKSMPKLGLGVHLNLSKGKALSKRPAVNCLVDKTGDFNLSAKKLWFLSIVSHKVRTAIYSELAEQIQWLIDRGINPTHLDSHYHIHSFPGLYSIICRLAAGFNVRAMRWVYEPKEVSNVPWPISNNKGKKDARVYRFFAKINRLQNSDFIKSNAFVGIAHSGRIDVNFFKAVALYCRGAVTEVMTHPAVNSQSYDREKGLQRETELKAICDERTRQYFSEGELELIHYGRL